MAVHFWAVWVILAEVKLETGSARGAGGPAAGARWAPPSHTLSVSDHRQE